MSVRNPTRESVGCANEVSRINDEITPDDSISQVEFSLGRSRTRDFGNAVNSKMSHENVVEAGIKSRTTGRILRPDNSTFSELSRDCSEILATDRAREVMVRISKNAAQRKNLEEIEKLEFEKLFRDLEVETAIRKLRRAAEDDALKAEAEIWSGFENVDLGKPLRNSASIPNHRSGSNMPFGGIEENACQVSSAKTRKNVPFANASASNCANMGNENVFDISVLRELTASNVRMCMPKHDIEVFDGNPEHYITFKQSVKAIMESITLSTDEKLHYLYQYTTGEPK